MASHPRKKARTAPGTSSGSPYSDYPEWARLADDLPQEVLDNILKFLSSLPRAIHWGKHTPLNDIVQLHRLNGGLGKTLNRFHTLCISKTVDCFREREVYNWKVPTEGVLWTDSVDIARGFILKTGGESLGTIIIGDGMYDEEVNGRNMAQDFLEACRNVRSLSVVEDHGLWAFTFAMQLEKLELVIRSRTGVVLKSFPSLLQLNLHFHNYQQLNISVIEWASVGSKLESLILHKILMSQDELNYIRDHCANLKHIDMGPETDNEVISEFIGSFGEQLDFVHVRDMSENELNHIVHTCRNARLEATVEWDDMVLNTLRILGSRLEKIQFAYEYDEIDSQAWTAAWDACSNVRVLEGYESKVEEIRAIMHTPKYHLKEMRIEGIWFEDDRETIDEILDIIAEGANNLQFLYFRCGITPSLDAFDKVIEKNKDSLRSVTICCGKNQITQSDVGEMVLKFLQCPLLQDISFDVLPVESVLKTLARRGVHFQK